MRRKIDPLKIGSPPQHGESRSMKPSSSELNGFDDALREARAGLRNGDRFKARRWAQRAALLDPGREEPWLILAQVASLPARLAYLARALRDHPASPALLQALRDAREQERMRSLEATQPIRVSPPGVTRLPPTHRFGKTTVLGLSGMGVLLGIALLLWLTWPGAIPRASSAYSLAPTLAPVSRLSPTAFPTSSPSPTPFQAQTYTPTPSPTLTPTATPTDTPTPTPSPSPTPTAGPKSIVVDISDQRVYAYQGNKLVFQYPASTGSGGSTLTGNFSILDKEPDAYSDPYGFWMPDWMGIYYVGSDLENGFHALPVLPDGNTLWGSQIGTPVTYGCVVLETDDMQALYKWAAIGTPVTIRW